MSGNLLCFPPPVICRAVSASGCFVGSQPCQPCSHVTAEAADSDVIIMVIRNVMTTIMFINIALLSCCCVLNYINILILIILIIIIVIIVIN